MENKKQRSFLESVRVLITVSRPVFWIVLPLLYVGGFLFQNDQATFSILNIVILLWLSFPFCIFLYGINDVHDLESDLKNPRKGGIQGLRLHPDNHQLVLHASVVVNIILLVLIGLDFSIDSFITALLLIFFSYAYSAPPLRLKERPVLDSLTNGLLYVLFPFYLGFFTHSGIEDTSWKIILTVLGAAGVHAYTSTLDYTSDKEVGDTTIAVILGPRITLGFSLLTSLLALFFAGYQTLSLQVYLIILSIVYGITLLFPQSKQVSKFGSFIVYGGFCIAASVYIVSQLF